jgi:hypothetical protein
MEDERSSRDDPGDELVYKYASPMPPHKELENIKQNTS